MTEPMSRAGDANRLDYAGQPMSLRRRLRRRWIILVSLIAAYVLSWSFAGQIGLVGPCGNMRYYYFSASESLDTVLYVVYWPMIRLSEEIETTRWGASRSIYYRERSFPTAKELGRP